MTVRDLHDMVRRVPALATDDSAARAIRIMRAKGVPALPAAEGHRLVGLVTEADLVNLIAGAPDPGAVLRSTPVSQVMQPLPVSAVEGQQLTSLAVALREQPSPVILVAAADGRYLGLLVPTDVLAALAGEPVVPPIAGLATPFGIHLTTGALRAGASDLGLAATGAALMILNLLSSAAVSGLARLSHDLLRMAPAWAEAPGLAAIAVTYTLQIGVFLLLLRISPLTGIHGAEHMVVRAVEEGADLTPEKVKAMPRVHPRCGTNLMALLVLLVIAQQFLSPLKGANQLLALLLLVMVVLLIWRRLGAGLQRWATTKQPSERQLVRAVAVAEELLDEIKQRPSASASMPRRVWNSGFLQVLAGFFAIALGAEYAPRLAVGAWHLLTG